MAVFFLFMRLLNWVSAARLGEVRWQIVLGVLAVFGAVNGLYFLNVLPPLPLAMQKAGVYHSIKRLGPVYYAMGEQQSWHTYFGIPPVMHVQTGEPLFVYTAVFAPIRLSTNIIHRWQRYDDAKKQWVTKETKPFVITGGRENGYRDYSKRKNPQPGLWRVDVDTVDGRLIGRVEFVVVPGPSNSANLTTVMN